MNVKHTPGPWRQQSGSQYRAWVENESMQTICHVNRQSAGVRDANARLISAAPELLESLEQISHAEAATYDDIHAAIQDLVGIARAAIAKATGG